MNYFGPWKLFWWRIRAAVRTFQIARPWAGTLDVVRGENPQAGVTTYAVFNNLDEACEYFKSVSAPSDSDRTVHLDVYQFSHTALSRTIARPKELNSHLPEHPKPGA